MKNIIVHPAPAAVPTINADVELRNGVSEQEAQRLRKLVERLAPAARWALAAAPTRDPAGCADAGFRAMQAELSRG